MLRMSYPSKTPKFTGFIFSLIGLVLLGGGLYLASLGGSWYYIVAGLALLGTAYFLYRCSVLALWVFTALFIGTLIWSV